MNERERSVQLWKDCFWDLEAKLARWFGLDDSRYEYELALAEEEREREARAREEAAREEDARAVGASSPGAGAPRKEIERLTDRTVCACVLCS